MSRNHFPVETLLGKLIQTFHNSKFTIDTQYSHSDEAGNDFYNIMAEYGQAMYSVLFYLHVNPKVSPSLHIVKKYLELSRCTPNGYSVKIGVVVDEDEPLGSALIRDSPFYDNVKAVVCPLSQMNEHPSRYNETQTKVKGIEYTVLTYNSLKLESEHESLASLFSKISQNLK